MVSKRYLRKVYASAFSTFLLLKLEEKSKWIDRIILYGSVAKGESTEKSDVDIFIDTEKKELEEKIREIVEDFSLSREFLLFKSKGVDNDISVKVGKLSEWPDLHRSIGSTGIVLFGSIELKKRPLGSKHRMIFWWSDVEKGRTSFLNKLYGYKSRGRKYEGLVQKWGGEKLGKSCIMIPIKKREEMIRLIKKHGVNARNLEVFTV